MNPVTTPSEMSVGTSPRRNERTGGRTISQRNTAPHDIRNQAAPAAPTCSISGTERALESCTASIATTAIDHGGIVGAVRFRAIMHESGGETPARRR